jgi:hypothetical protein
MLIRGPSLIGGHRRDVADRERKVNEDLDSISRYGQIIRNDALPGTYNWAFDLDKMKTWARGDMRVLLFHGHPGTGKSTLLSYFADVIEAKSRSNPDIGVAFVRSGHDACNLRTIEDVLRAILRQLCEKQPGTLARVMASKTHPNTWPRERIKDHIRLCASGLTKVFLFVDAIDELEASMGRGLLLNLLECQTDCNAYMILTSTINDSRLNSYPTFEFRARDGDISTYVESEARNLRQGLLRGGSLPDEVARQIIEVSNGV